MSKEGFDNEKRIVNNLNNQRFTDLNNNLKEFVRDLFPEINNEEIICASCDGGQNKSDLLIWTNTNLKDKKRISVKRGSGNSVHQEPIEGFIKYLDNNYSVNIQIKNDLRFFIWGDYTFNGLGKKEDRMSSIEISNKFPDLINRISLFMDKNKIKLIERFVIKGPKSKSSPDFIYYGDEKKGYWGKSKQVLKMLSKKTSNSAVPIGGLTFQAWNRAIKEGSSSEHKRGVIQLKWPSIKEDLKRIMKK